MNLRRIKRRTNALIYERRIHARSIRRSAEEMAWLDAAPIGREFGSPDYDRLAILDKFTWGQATAEDTMRKLGVNEAEFAAMLDKDGLTRTSI